MEKFPFLVQRVLLRPQPSRTTTTTSPSNSKGVDREFSFDYMGSAEFEWGALPQSLKAMRQISNLEILPLKHNHPDVKGLWFFGAPKSLPQAQEFVSDQLGPMSARLKERTNMKETLIEKDPHCMYVAWWALVPQPWLVFIQKDTAKLWLKSLTA